MPEAYRVDILIKTSTGGKWILEQAEELLRRGNKVRVILPLGRKGELGKTLERHRIETVESPTDFRFRPNFGTIRGLYRLRREIRRNGTDVVLSHLYASTLAARISTLGLALRRVQMVAGPLFLESALVRAVERSASRVDHVIINGCANARDRYVALGYPSERSPVISYGVDTRHYSRDEVAKAANPSMGQVATADHASALRAEVRDQLGISRDAFVAIMVAFVYGPKGLVHKGVGIKGHHLILEAWRRFSDSHPNTHLLLVGGGHGAGGERYREELIRNFELNSSPNVLWLESVDDVRKYYVAADVSVSPSLSEGHGAALEASSMSLPSIVSDAGGLPETVTSDSGWVVPRGKSEPLLNALDVAYREFKLDRLGRRGEHARRLAEKKFDRMRNAGAVADVVEKQASQVQSKRCEDLNSNGDSTGTISEKMR
ncbi:glycosyltransferase [Actinoplanes sp. NPDC049681]|uniref:glycosyltransferase n=1 Tax=Actinoplanes sp. NPDC049681 TaxID=3363905 RepID=UPI0037B0ED80